MENNVTAANLRWFDAGIIERVRLHGYTFLRDALLVALGYGLAETLRFNGDIPRTYIQTSIFAILLASAIHCLWNYRFGIHRRIWRYAGLADIRALVDASILSMIVLGVIAVAWPDGHLLPMTVIPAGGAFATAALAATRLGKRMRRTRGGTEEGNTRLLIIGAGEAGQLVGAEMLTNGSLRQHLVGFIDDDPWKRRMKIHGVPVLGTVNDIPRVVAEHAIDVVAVAIPSANSKEIDRILDIAQQTPARIQILPSRAALLLGEFPLQLRDINLDDLLDRIPGDATAEGDLVRSTVEGRVVLVTGARGSIGAEICRQVLRFDPACLLALDNNETGLFYLQKDLASDPNVALLTTLLADVSDPDKMDRIFRQYQPAVVFHAAAYKHVPMLEAHPEEAIHVNVVGTANLCRAAVENGCERFVYISTDKAVHPVNALGFSKRIGELIIRAYEGQGTRFCSVRFGNVIGSRGSALPEFVHQIDAGGPVTVTHPDVERYFMTIPEAVSLVIQAGAFANGGELFMLDMGKPMKLVDLVQRIIRLRGLRIGADIEIRFTGLRPGEKLTEELVFEAEQVQPTRNPMIFAIDDEIHPDLGELTKRLDILEEVAHDGDREMALAALASVALHEGMIEAPLLMSAV